MADSNETRERQRELEEKKRRLDELRALRAANHSRQRVDGRASLMIDSLLFYFLELFKFCFKQEELGR